MYSDKHNSEVGKLPQSSRIGKAVKFYGLFSFAEFPVASGLRSRSGSFGGVGCHGDEGEENSCSPMHTS